MSRRQILLLVAIALLARVLLLGWDAGVGGPHPDERQVGYVAEQVGSWTSDPGFYAYGSLHFFAVRVVAAITGLTIGQSGLILAGRLVSLLSSLAALALGWWLARRAWGRRTADLFLLLTVLVPLDLQQSHYATVEAHHAFWVMATLAAAWWTACSGRSRAAIVLGAAAGASLAVKVSSLSLGLVVLVVIVVAATRRDWPTMPRLAAWAGLAGLASFWLGQPTAFAHRTPPAGAVAALALAALAWTRAERSPLGRRRGPVVLGAALLLIAVVLAGVSASPLLGRARPAGLDSVAGWLAGSLAPALAAPYVRGVDEQVAMVTGRADLPYVRVYAATVPVLYPLRELALWGVGPALLVAALWGCGLVVVRLARRWRRLLGGRRNRASALLIVLLVWLAPMALRLATLDVKFLRYWTPLVVPAALVTAWALVRLGRRRRWIGQTVVATTLLWGVMYLWAFVAPHPHRTAAQWLSAAMSADEVVAFEHWDETLAIRPEDGSVSIVRLPSYELPDDDAKIADMLAVLQQADWLVLTSNRVRATVLANPDRYPRTGRLYRLLLAGEAGFELVTTASRAPRLLGIELPVQRADESFVNYEMPRVVILRRLAEVDVEQLAAELERPLPYLEGLDGPGLEARFVASAPRITPQLGGLRQLVVVVLWAMVLLLAGAAAWLLLLPVTRGLPDTGVGLALVTGWIVPAWALWMGSELGLLTVGPAAASWLLLAALAAALALVRRRRPLIARLWPRRRRAIVTVLAVGAGVLLLFLAIRAVNPAIYWGEKPMDFSFLNAFLRADAWPTGEPWLAGMPLHYYYFGEVLAALPLLLTGVPAAIGYNLDAAAVPAFAAVVLAGLGALLAGRRRARTGAVVLPMLVLLTGNLAWPFLLGMARAHRWFDLWWATSRVVPVAAAIDEYPLWTALFADLHGHFLALPVLLAAFTWALVAVHLRDRRWLVAAAGCGLAVAVLVATNPWDLLVLVGALSVGVVLVGGAVWRSLVRLTVAAAISLLAAAPFVVELVRGLDAGAGGGRIAFLTDADFAPAWAVVRHLGLFLLPLLVVALPPRRDLKLVLPLTVVGALAGLSFGSQAAALALAAMVVLLAAAARSRCRLDRLAFALATVAMVVVGGAERFTLIDRMNTIFKLYNGVWVLLAVALGILLVASPPRRRQLLVAVWLPLELVALVNLPLGVAQSWLQPRIASPRPTLDGQAYLRRRQPDEWFAVQVVAAVARPGEAVAEAAGDAYGPYTRIAMHTGVPTVVGWPWHLQQRGHARSEVDARYADLATLYGGSNPRQRRRILDRYRVGWIVVTALERRTYSLGDGDPFADVPGVVPFARHGRAAVNRVRPLPAGPQPLVRRGDAASLPALPPGVERLAGVVAAPVLPVARAARAVGDGIAVLLWDGSVAVVDAAGATRDHVAAAPCVDGVLGVVGEQPVVSCATGDAWQAAGNRWRRLTVLPAGAIGLTAAGGDDATTWWAWGPGGGWVRAGAGSWRRVVTGAVTTLAVTPDRIAWADGTRVWAGATVATAQPVAGALARVTQLSWDGASLWAVAAAGVYRSGGALLPWRAAAPGVDHLVAAVTTPSGVRLLQATGELLDVAPPLCRSPWQSWPQGTAGGLREPRGLAVAAAGWFVVADTLGHGVVAYDRDGGCLDRWGVVGDQPGQFREPAGVAIAPDGTVAVADTWNGRIQLLRGDGTVAVVGSDLYGPRDVVFTPEGGVVVADTGNRRVVEFAPPSWRERIVVRFEHAVVGLAWVDGLLAVAVPDGGIVALVEPASGSVRRTLEVPGWHDGGQQEGYLARLGGGELVATAPRSGGLWLLDTVGDRPPRQIAAATKGLTGIAVLPGGRLLAAQTWEHQLVRLAPQE